METIYRQRTLTDAEQRVLRSAFHDADLNFKGYLDREDFKIATVSLFGYKPSKYEVNQMVEKAGLQLDTGITYDQFVTLMTPKMLTKDDDEEIRQTFVAFDIHCRRFLTLEDLNRVFSRIAPNLPKHTIEAAFREIDRDGDGRVSYKDFEFMMKYSFNGGM